MVVRRCVAVMILGGLTGALALAGSRPPESPGEATARMQRECESGNTRTCLQLGLGYAEGSFVEKDVARAREVFERLCATKWDEGCGALGLSLANATGDAPPSDPPWLAGAVERACDKKDEPACVTLALLLRDGRGVARDEARARSLLERYCRARSEEACRALGASLGEGAGDAARTVDLLEEACSRGIGSACGVLVDAAGARLAARYRARGMEVAESPRYSPGTNSERTVYDTPPRPLRKAAPKYPPEAFRRRIQGVVYLAVLIDATGAVAGVEVAHSVPMLDDAAIRSVQEWRFAPARKGGHPVASIATTPVGFKIN